MDKKEIDKWSDRYFHLCLTLISRPSFSSFGNTSPVNIRDIINKADRMIQALQERDKDFYMNYENE